MAKRKSVSSPREKRLAASVLYTTPIADREREELENVAKTPDAKIDFSDIRELKRSERTVLVGRFYRPVKQLVSIRMDADLLAWFRARGRKYQTYMNEVLRREMQAHMQGR